MRDRKRWFLIGVAMAPAPFVASLAGLAVAVLIHGNTDITNQQSALMATALLTAGIVGIICGIVIGVKGGLTEGK